MQTRYLLAIAFAVVLTGAAAGHAPQAAAQPNDGGWGYGMMGPGMMGGYGPGMMGGYGPGMMGGYGPGMMGGYGPGMMGGYGPGMMGGYGPGGYGPGMGPWMMGRGGWGMMGGYGPGGAGWAAAQPANLNISVDDVKSYMQRWVAMTGNPHIKVGNVAEKDADTITADIVTTDKDALVQRYDVNRHTGFIRPSAS